MKAANADFQDFCRQLWARPVGGWGDVAARALACIHWNNWLGPDRTVDDGFFHALKPKPVGLCEQSTAHLVNSIMMMLGGYDLSTLRQ